MLSIDNMKKNHHIILASSSPRRELLLKQIGVNFKIIPSKIKENLCLNLPPEAMAEHWAREKAKNISIIQPEKLIIGADTIISFNNKILGKPINKKDSFKMLKKLSGKTHEVITGVSFFNKNSDIDFTFNNKTFVTLNKLKNKDITFYIENFNVLDKAGSYGIQDLFAIHIKEIKGCYYNVMGLPLSSFYYYFNSIQKNLK